MAIGRLPVALPIVIVLGAIALIVFGSDHFRIAGLLLLGLALSMGVIKRSPEPVEPTDDERR